MASRDVHFDRISSPRVTLQLHRHSHSHLQRRISEQRFVRDDNMLIAFIPSVPGAKSAGPPQAAKFQTSRSKGRTTQPRHYAALSTTLPSVKMSKSEGRLSSGREGLRDSMFLHRVSFGLAPSCLSISCDAQVLGRCAWSCCTRDGIHLGRKRYLYKQVSWTVGYTTRKVRLDCPSYFYSASIANKLFFSHCTTSTLFQRTRSLDRTLPSKQNGLLQK